MVSNFWDCSFSTKKSLVWAKIEEKQNWVISFKFTSVGIVALITISIFHQPKISKFANFETKNLWFSSEFIMIAVINGNFDQKWIGMCSKIVILIWNGAFSKVSTTFYGFYRYLQELK